jgi:hypothetical protein
VSAAPPPGPTIESITSQLIDLVPAEARSDLVVEDPASAIALYFDPVELQRLPRKDLVADECSTDGYYDPFIDPECPRIIYADDVAPRRIRFTLLHELGHHLFNTSAARLLDDLDRLGGSSERAKRLEEFVCHGFASELLLPTQLVDHVLPTNSPVLPQHVRELHESAREVSLDAVAVRVAHRLHTPGAVVIIRNEGTVAFCAARGLEGGWWPRDSVTDPNGALVRALRIQQTARPDTYRWQLPFARQLHCDTLPVHGQLAIGVLSTNPSDGSLNIVEEVEPAWKTREYWCEQCNEERTQGWCDRCHGPHCPDCGRCGCIQPKRNPLCKQCGLQNPFRAGASMCVDCEKDRGLL